jgi:hypothetical protein
MSSKVAPTPGPDEGMAQHGMGYDDAHKQGSWMPAGFKHSFFSNKAASDVPTEEKGSSIWWTLENLRMNKAHFPDYVSFPWSTGWSTGDFLLVQLYCGMMRNRWMHVSFHVGTLVCAIPDSTRTMRFQKHFLLRSQ